MGFRKVPFKKIYTDEQGHPIDKHGNRINVEELDIPMWRSYGVHKIHRPKLAKFGDVLFKAIAIFFITPVIWSIAIVGVAIVYYARIYPAMLLLTFIMATAALVFLYCVILRMPRKRLKFRRRLKRFCKKNGYKLEIKRGFFNSLRWADDESVDMVVKACGWTYYVKEFSSRTKRSDVTLCQSGELIYKKHPRRSLYSRMMDFKTRVKTKRICFPEHDGNEKTINAVVLNPAPAEMYKKRLNKDTELTGNHDEVFGYTVFTGSGFIDAIRRNIEKEKRDIENGRF